MLLSKHFDSEEFDCHCCNQGGDEMSPVLIELLEQLRADCGGYPLFINSGYRCSAHNAEVGGVKNSQHVLKTAADVARPYELTYDEFYHACLECKLEDGRHFDGVGYYRDDNFVHVDVRDDGLGERVTW